MSFTHCTEDMYFQINGLINDRATCLVSHCEWSVTDQCKCSSEARAIVTEFILLEIEIAGQWESFNETVQVSFKMILPRGKTTMIL